MSEGKVHLSFNDLQARFMIETCRLLEQQLVSRARAEGDEDLQADLGNDSGYVGSLRESIELAAEEVFGAEVSSFSRPPTF